MAERESAGYSQDAQQRKTVAWLLHLPGAAAAPLAIVFLDSNLKTVRRVKRLLGEECR